MRAMRSKLSVRWIWLAGLAAALWFGRGLVPPAAPRALAASQAATAPASPPAAPAATADNRLSDRAYWSLVTRLSEPEGYFDSDNLVSNEDTFQWVIPSLQKAVPRGRVYLGVGPDQNFPYIAAVDPRLAFIVDVRRGNLHVQLMYKALFEIASDRADFLSRLFARPRPSGLDDQSTVEALFAAYARTSPDEAAARATSRAILTDLRQTHGFALSPTDATAIDRVYRKFVEGGPDMTFVSSRPFNRYPSYTTLQTATDANGVQWGYLASEARFRWMKAYESANRVVPVVGDFGGTKALRAIGAYLAAQHDTVGVFYTSNVERYLFQDGAWRRFLENVETLPLDASSTFVRSCFDSCGAPGGSRAVTLVDSMTDLIRDVHAGRVVSYFDVLRHSRER
jgi:hypothetical protein